MTNGLSKTKAMEQTSNEVLLPADLTAQNTVKYWKQVISSNSTATVFNASNVKTCDESGIALLFQIRNSGKNLKLVNLSEDIEQVYSTMTKNLTEPSDIGNRKLGFVESCGQWLLDTLKSTRSSLSFFGESLCAVSYMIFHPHKIRFKEIYDVGDDTGSNAVAIVCLIGFLMGVIIAFETALVAKIFGAVIFVVNGIGIAVTRELGPLMTAILFAGRSGSSFAAQLGTQKVNEELNALTTFGLKPMYFLVVPRLLASSIVVPLLSIFASLMGILGGALVMGLYDITPTQFYMQLIQSVDLGDIFFGLGKAVIFGYVIAMIGCECGMNTGAGAAAVGISTTKAVVRSIVWIVVIDGVAALLSNRLGF